MQFKRYRKTTMTVARPLTEDDFLSRNGIIQTNEGPCHFMSGDFLARDAKGEWPIYRREIERNYTQAGESDSDGWANYQPLDIREACQMTEPFTAGGLQGQVDDYLVRSGGNEWPVECEVFEASYTPVEETERIEHL